MAERLRERSGVELIYYGTPDGPERAVSEAEGFGLPARPRLAAALTLARTCRARAGQPRARLTRGAALARHGRPGAVFATGGYAAAPVGRAARREGIPLLLFLPDVRPGWAIRSMRGQAQVVACSVPDSLRYLPRDRSVVTGYPTRRQFRTASREPGAQAFGLDPGRMTLLVTGGSLGAHHINLVIARSLRTLLEQAQIIHIAGHSEETWLAHERERLPAWLQERYALRAYTDEMALAMAAADLAVTRAGASVLGELPAAGLPAIVIPGAFSDQHENASYLERHGAALTLSGANVEDLSAEILRLVENDASRERMAQAMRELDRPEAAEQLAQMLEGLAA